MSWLSARCPLSAPCRASPSTTGRNSRAAAIVSVMLVALLASGCGGSGFQPMYAALPDGSGLGQRLAHVEITTIPGRTGQLIRNELLFQTHGADKPPPPKHRLNIAIRENVLSTLVSITGDSLSQVYTVDATFQLVDLKTNAVVYQGVSSSRAAFDRYSSIYANVRGQQDAQRRAAMTVAQDLKSRLAAYLART